MDPIAYTELVENAGDVGLDGRFTENEFFGDLTVGHATGEELEYLEFARTEFGEFGSGIGGCSGDGKFFDQSPGDAR